MARKDTINGGKVSKKSKNKEKYERNGAYSAKAIRLRETVLENRKEKHGT